MAATPKACALSIPALPFGSRLRTGKKNNFPFSAMGAMLSGHAWLGVKTAAAHPESMMNPQGTHAFAVKCQASMVLHTIRESMAPTNQEVIHPNDPKPRQMQISAMERRIVGKRKMAPTSYQPSAQRLARTSVAGIVTGAVPCGFGSSISTSEVCNSCGK